MVLVYFYCLYHGYMNLSSWKTTRNFFSKNNTIWFFFDVCDAAVIIEFSSLKMCLGDIEWLQNKYLTLINEHNISSEPKIKCHFHSEPKGLKLQGVSLTVLGCSLKNWWKSSSRAESIHKIPCPWQSSLHDNTKQHKMHSLLVYCLR